MWIDFGVLFLCGFSGVCSFFCFFVFVFVFEFFFYGGFSVGGWVGFVGLVFWGCCVDCWGSGVLNWYGWLF